MERLDEDMRHCRSIQLNQYQDVHFFNRRDENGNQHVAIVIDQTSPVGVRQEFKTDMDRMEGIARAATELIEQPRELRGDFETKRVSRYDVDFISQPKNLNPNELEIRVRKPSELSEEGCTLNPQSIESIINVGKEIERELGYVPNHYSLVFKSSLHVTEGGRVEATVAHSFPGLQRAQILAARNDGLVFSTVMTRRPVEEKTTVDFSVRDSIEIKGGASISVGEQIKQNGLFKERETANFVIAQWHSPEIPRPGDRAHWGGLGVEPSGALKEYLAMPANIYRGSEPESPIFVVIQRDTGIIECCSTDRKELCEMLPHFQTTYNKQQQEIEKTKEQSQAQSQDINLAKESINTGRYF